MVFEQIWGAAESLAQDWNKRLAGRWRNYATGGDFFTPPHSTEGELLRETFVQKFGGGQVPKRNYGQKIEGPATTQPSPPLSDGDSGPQGRRWCRCSQSCEIATLFPPPTFPLLPLSTPPFPRLTPLPPPQHLPWAKTRHLPRDRHNQSQSTRTSTDKRGLNLFGEEFPRRNK